MVALEAAFFKSFDFVDPTNKRICIALDVSGSMGSPIMNSCVPCRDAAAAMTLLALKTEPHVRFGSHFSQVAVEKNRFNKKKTNIWVLRSAKSKYEVLSHFFPESGVENGF